MLSSGHNVLVDIVVGAAGDGNGNGVVEDDGESVMDGVNEDGVQAGDVVGLAEAGGLVTGVGELSIEEAEEELSGLVDGNGTEEGADGDDETVGEEIVLHAAGGGSVSSLEGLVHLEGELHGSTDGASGEEDEGDKVDGLGEAEEVTDDGVATVGLEGGAGSTGVRSLHANRDGGLSDPEGGENTRDDANDTAGGRVEDGDGVLENGVALGAEEAPKSGEATDEQRSQVVVVILHLDVVEHGVEFGPVEAGIEDASLGGVLSNRAVAVRRDGGTISAALGVVEKGISLNVSDEGGNISEAAAAGAAEGEGASSHCYFIVFN